ncbi:MAG: hypothetical protein ACI841_003379 [Planctomycetota bacterium]|jgi:hypothetical protein
MNLPFRIQDEAGTEAVLSIDGSFGAPGLELGHWPGNRTPRELKHDLSTGCALRFMELPESERGRLSEGLVAIANNHVDTDGVLALFALLRPKEALARREALLQTAEAGDRFRTPTEAAFQLDQIITVLFDEKRSPWRAHTGGMSRRERHEWCSLRIVDELPAWLDGDIEALEDLWRGPLARLRSDREDLAAAQCDDLVHLSSILWTAPMNRASTAAGETFFDPGRHALFGATRADRVVVLGPSTAGTHCRMIIGTGSFFDLVDEQVPARPQLALLVARLNELEGSRDGDACAWRSDAQDHASPELWFGVTKTGSFPTHALAYSRPSKLDALRIKSELIEGLRAAFLMSDEEAESSDLDWMNV